MDCMFYSNGDGNIYQKVAGNNTSTMKPIEANSTDAANEKHVPFVTKENGKIKVDVGQILHPMDDDHYIEFVEQDCGGKKIIKYLKPGQEPVVYFKDKPCMLYAYCNKHGLWQYKYE